MSLAKALIGELQHEAASTRRMFERLPEASFGWKPHEKSMTLGALAGHVAEVVEWLPFTINTPGMDWATMEYQPPKADSIADVMNLLDKNVADAVAVLESVDEAVFMENWEMRNGDQVYFNMPKAIVIRNFVMNHLVHHRAQLGVYLRLLNVPVPGMYGPTADEQVMAPATA